MTEQDNCNHNFGSWKRVKNIFVDCEDMGLESRVYYKDCYKRTCKECGYIEIKEYECKERNTKKGKNKHLGLNMKHSK